MSYDAIKLLLDELKRHPIPGDEEGMPHDLMAAEVFAFESERQPVDAGHRSEDRKAKTEKVAA